MSEATGSNPSPQAGAENVPGNAAPIEQQAEKAAQEAVKRHKFQYEDGTSEEVDEAEVLKIYKERKQHTKGAEAKMKEAAEKRNQVDDFLRNVKNDPRALFKHLGLDDRKWASDIMTEYMEDEMMDPTAKEKRDMQRKLEELQNKEKEREAGEKKKVEEERRKQFNDEVDRELSTVLKEGGVPNNEFTAARILYYFQYAMNNGWDHLPVNQILKEIVPVVKKDWKNEVQTILTSYDDDTLLDILGDALTEKTNKAYLNKYKKKEAEKKEKPAEKKAAPAEKKTKYMSRDEWRAMLAERNGYKAE